MTARLGSAEIYAGEVVNMKKGDVIPLDQYASDPVNIYVEGVLKFQGNPVIYQGKQAIRFSNMIKSEEVMDYGTE
jgi:flagellar motor switch protein FliM